MQVEKERYGISLSVLYARKTTFTLFPVHVQTQIVMDLFGSIRLCGGEIPLKIDEGFPSIRIHTLFSSA